MIYKAKVGNEDMYVEVIGSNIVKVLKLADEQIKEHTNFRILEIRNSKNQLIDIDKYRRKISKIKQNDLGYMNKDTIAKCYRSVQQAMWYKYDEEKYAKIKVDLKEIKNSSKNIDEFKEKLAKYIESLENQGI